MIRRTFYNKLVVILWEAVKRRPKNLARLSEEKTVREILRSEGIAHYRSTALREKRKSL
jgi:hypothetical protein